MYRIHAVSLLKNLGCPCLLSALAVAAIGCSGGDARAMSTAGSGGTGPIDTDLSITVLVIDDHFKSPVADIDLVVNDASGVVVRTARSDQTGKAQLVIPKGGSVSAFFSESFVFQRYIFFDPPEGTPVTFVLHLPHSD